jgi:hypothetical protein
MPEPHRPAYLRDAIALHLRHHFRSSAATLWAAARVRFAPLGELVHDREADVLVPTDLESGLVPRETWSVPFGGTQLRLWNRVPPPPGWRTWPSAEAPLWHLAADGRAIPAWDLYGNLSRLLSLAEDLATGARDAHGRVPDAASPRVAAGLHDVPALNDAAAALVALLAARRRGATDPDPQVRDHVLPPAVVLSHDLDLLRGNDPITQSIRLWRMVRPLARGRAPQPRFARALVENARHPRRHYLEALDRVVALEREHGARSAMYFLNGSGGRHGARSGARDIPSARARVPEGWCVGMHYNYDTLLDPVRFESQRRQLEPLIGEPVRGGRAHYLRFEPRGSFAFLEAHGLLWDETLGFRDHPGYRAGVAGAYHPPDAAGRPMRLLALPLAIMDVTVAALEPAARERLVLGMLAHLAEVGGTLTALFHLEEVGHPDLDGDERPYAALLAALRRAGARFRVPTDYLDAVPTT